MKIRKKGGKFNNSKAKLMQTVSGKIQKKSILILYAGGRFNNFKAILLQVIVDNEIILKRWSKNSVRIYKKNILLALFFVTLLWFVTPKMMTKYLYFFFIFFLKKYKKNTFYKVNLNPSV